MAVATIKLPEDFLLKASKLGNQTDEIIEKTLEAGGDVILPKVKSNLKSVIGKDLKFEGRTTGELIESLGLSPVEIDDKETHNIKIGFNEPRRNQYEAKSKRSYYTITNAMIANVIEYGKSGQDAKPFLKPAKSASRKSCIETMKKKLESEIQNL